MDIEINEFKNISKSEIVREKVENILRDFKRNNNKAYLKAQALLEFLNAKIIIKHLKFELHDLDIIRITEVYRNVDKELFEEMVSINGEYNVVDTDDVSDNDVVTLLYHIDSVVEIILKKYPDVI